MARIAGITIPNEKRVEIALTYIYGIGRATSGKLLHDANVDLNKRVKDLTEDEINRIRELITKMPVEGDLRRIVSRNIRHMQEINSYKGVRHKRRLPARGQRTKTNARTKRGKRVTMGSGKVKLQKT
jgi:small subunit ribosomal protein S13